VRLHVGAVLDVDGEASPDPYQRLVDGRCGVAVALDRDLVADAELALLDLGYLISEAFSRTKVWRRRTALPSTL
jgi:hypothetical protein